MSKRFVIDTNVLLRAILVDKSLARLALNKIIENHVLLQSDDTENEFSTVIQRSKFDKYVSKETRNEFHNNIKADAMFIEISETIRVCRDPKDDKFLELAVSGKADYILTFDEDLLILNPFQNIQIITPDDFLKLD